MGRGGAQPPLGIHRVVSRGRVHGADLLPAFFTESGGKRVGFATYITTVTARRSIWHLRAVSACGSIPRSPAASPSSVGPHTCSSYPVGRS